MDSGSLRRVLITGASSGIGKAAALAFAKAGFDVALLGRSAEKLRAVAAEAAAHGVLAKAYCVDLSQLREIQPRLIDLQQDFGPIDVLVNNAGMGYTGALATMPLADWEQVLSLNLTSVFQCVQALLPTLRQHRGTIVNIASVAGKSAFPGWGAYSVSKAGLITFSKVLAAEEREHGIRVVVVSPGAVNTSIWDTETVHADFDRSQMLTPEVVADSILNAVQLPSYAVMDEISLMPSAGAL